MEKTKLGTVFSLKVGWNDIGNWKSIWENSKKMSNGNTLKGKVITEDVKNCYLRSEERLLVGIDIQNLVIVETNDAILVSNKDSTQKVKKLFRNLISAITKKEIKAIKIIDLGAVLLVLRNNQLGK